MTKSVTTQELARFIPLNALNNENLRELAEKARPITIAAGRYLFRGGERPPHQVFLIKGSVELIGEHGIDQILEAGSREAARSLDAASPHARAARAKTEVHALTVDRDLLDLMLTWEQTGSYDVQELGSGKGESPKDEGAGDPDWMTRLLETACFRRIPPANIQAIFMRMEPVGFQAGEVVIRQDEPGDYFYIIREGRCQVSRATRAKPQGVRLAELGNGDSFGEEALISDKERNATVTMKTAGTLMRLSKSNFDALLKEPLLQEVDYAAGKALVEKGAKWIDVRLPGEFEGGHIDSALNIPLFFLRMKAQKLDPATTYILYCDSGRRSSAASFLLSERGFTAQVLTHGLAKVPPEAIARKASV